MDLSNPIDLVASLGSNSWKWCWKGPELDGPVLAIDQGPTESWVAFGAPLNERWKYDDLWFLRGRTPLPESFEQVELHGARWAGLQGDQVVVEDQGPRRFPVGPGGRCVAVTPREVWWAEPDDQGVTVTTGPRAAQPVRLEGAGRVGARWRSPGWLGIHDDQGRVLWLDTEHGHLEGPHRL